MIERIRQIKRIIFLAHVALLIALAVFVLAYAVATAQGEEGSGAPAVDQISDFTKISIFLGAAGSFIVGAINRTRWSSETKFGAFFVYSCLAAALMAWWKREIDLTNWSSALLTIFVAGQATYMAGRGAIKGIESRTG